MPKDDNGKCRNFQKIELKVREHDTQRIDLQEQKLGCTHGTVPPPEKEEHLAQWYCKMSMDQ